MFEKALGFGKKHWKKIVAGAGIGLAAIIGIAVLHNGDDEDVYEIETIPENTESVPEETTNE